MEDVAPGLADAIRVLLSKLGFSIIAVSPLVIGIGANTATFSVVNANLLRLLPYLDSNEHGWWVD